ncbi:sigma factor-like helix-turn-helix DNA-binding protein [Pseudonocardia parietis]|uniref:sigma factor-like helix-turn-helix DNA-binding protein n=1 Tax=Pseudonocardia parietis TaxID=570936 RepID=UPI001AE38FD7
MASPWRRTFELVKVNGLSYAEAAEVLGVPIGTVRSRINRANAARAQHGPGPLRGPGAGRSRPRSRVDALTAAQPRPGSGQSR